MQSLFASHTAGWMVLTSLLAFSGQLAGCDTSAPSQRDNHEQAPTVSEQGASEPKEKPAAEEKTALKTPAPEDQKKADKKDGDEAEAESREQSSDEAPLVKRLVIASDVKEREPVELEDAQVKDPIVAFLELMNASEADSEVVVTFEHEGGKKVGFVKLEVPGKSPRYRTWARTRNITEAGEWTAVVTTKAGEELARQTFKVTG